MDKKRVYIYNIRRFEQIIAALLLLLFVGYYTNVSLLTHTHIVDGVTIVHSHIHSSDHAEQNGDDAHSTTELSLISALSNYIALTAELHTTICCDITEITPIFNETTEQQTTAPRCTIPQLRAPPAEFVIG
ncbi:MAG: hypothetical protein R3Y68_09665 [Rikenellaceae bacterium]